MLAQKQNSTIFIDLTECPLCSEKSGKIIRVESNTFSAEEIFFSPYLDYQVKLKKCDHCGFAYVHQLPADPQFFSELYKSKGEGLDIQFYYTGKKLIFAEIKKTLLRYKTRFSSQPKLLDVGASTGAFLNSVKVDFQTSGVELNPLAVEFGKSQGINLSCKSFMDLQTHKNSFDIITIIDVLEHLQNPKQVLSKIHQDLAPSGLLYIKVPNYLMQVRKQSFLNALGVSREGVMANYIHINHFSIKSLKNCLEKMNFKILETGYSSAEIWDLALPAPLNTKLRRALRNIMYRTLTLVFNQLAKLTGWPLGFNFYILAEKIK